MKIENNAGHMNAPDTVHFSYDQQPHLKEVVSKMRKGETTDMEIRLTLKGDDLEGSTWTVEAVIPPGYEIDKEATEPGAMGPAIGSSDAMMTPAAMAVRKKAAKAQTLT